MGIGKNSLSRCPVKKGDLIRGGLGWAQPLLPWDGAGDISAPGEVGLHTLSTAVTWCHGIWGFWGRRGSIPPPALVAGVSPVALRRSSMGDTAPGRRVEAAETDRSWWNPKNNPGTIVLWVSSCCGRALCQGKGANCILCPGSHPQGAAAVGPCIPPLACLQRQIHILCALGAALGSCHRGEASSFSQDHGKSTPSSEMAPST